MSDRIILIRIQGLGSLNTDAQLVFTSRGTLPYLPAFATLEGVVSNLGDQFSSEIGFFESMGSDPTTSFSVISTAETREALLGRRKVPVLDDNSAPVVTTSYIDAGYDVTFTVSSTASMYEGQRIRIGTIAFVVVFVTNATEVGCRRIWSSPLIPIPMILAGQEAVGMVVYDLLLSTGSVEMLPVVVSTAEVTATSRSEEEVIFRGVVTMVGVETSRGAANQITVQCGSLMGYLRNAPFRPTVGQRAAVSQVGHWTYREDLGEDGLVLSEAPVTIFTTHFNTGVSGTPSFTNEPHTTSARVLQVRDGGTGCAAAYSVIEYQPYIGLTITGQDGYVDDIDCRPATHLRKADCQRTFRHAVAGKKRLRVEARRRKRGGELRQRFGMNHFSTDTGNTPRREIQILRIGRSQASSAQDIAEGRTERHRGSVHRHQLEPKTRAHRKIPRRKIVD